jgi:uncharacterized membrane-anchored protein
VWNLRLGRFYLDTDLWLRGWIAAQRILWAIILLALHSGFKIFLKIAFAQEFAGIQKFAVVIEEVAILSLMFWFLLEAVRVFLPLPWGINLDLDGSK